MIRIGILGNIGSGKSYVANNLGYPVFDADYEVDKLYKKNKKIFSKLNKIFNSKDVLVFVESKKRDINKNIKKRPNFNSKLLNIFKKTQLSPSYKKKKSHFIIKNDFTKKTININIKDVKKKIN